MIETGPMRRAIVLCTGLAAGAVAAVAGRRWHQSRIGQERSLVEAEILAGLDEVEAARVRLNAEFAAHL